MVHFHLTSQFSLSCVLENILHNTLECHTLLLNTDEM